MADQHDRSPQAVKRYLSGPVIPKSGGSYFNLTCPFCGTHNRAYIWSIAGGGKKCENKTCRAKFDSFGNAYPRIPGPRERARASVSRETPATGEHGDPGKVP